MALQRLREAAEKAKIELSSALQVCSFVKSGFIAVEITQSQSNSCLSLSIQGQSFGTKKKFKFC